MERHDLMRLLAGDDEVSKAALTALAGGADYVVWEEGTRPSEAHARTFAARVRFMRRKGVETLGWERAVQLLGEHPQPIHVGQIMASDRSWIYTLFLTEGCGALVACAGVRRPDGEPQKERAQTSP